MQSFNHRYLPYFLILNIYPYWINISKIGHKVMFRDSPFLAVPISPPPPPPPPRIANFPKEGSDFFFKEADKIWTLWTLFQRCRQKNNPADLIFQGAPANNKSRVQIFTIFLWGGGGGVQIKNRIAPSTTYTW